MSWQRVPLARALGAYRADWDALNARYYGGHPFRDSRFIDASLKYFGTGREYLFIHRGGGAVDGLVILRERKPGLWQQFVPDQLQAAPILVPNTGFVGELLQSLPATAWAVELLNQDPAYCPPGLMDAASTKRVLPHALTMNVAPEGDFDTYWNSRSRNLVKNMRRYFRRAVEEYGASELRILTGPPSMADAVSRYGDLESRGWKKKTGTAVHIANDQGKFYAELMTKFAETGQAQVFEYHIGGHLAASRLVISGGGMSIILKTAYDESLSRVAPGRLLLHGLLEKAFEQKHQAVVEFYTNASADQLSWATGQRVISHITFFRKPWQASLYNAYQRIKASFAPRTTSTEEADQPALQVFERMSELPRECMTLFAEGEQDSFDLGADWFRLLVETALPEGVKPRFYVLTQGGETRCILPLLVGPHQVTGLTTFYSSLYRPLLADDLQADELAMVLRRAVRDTGASSLRLDAMDASHPSFELTLAALRQAGLKPFSFFAFGNWHLPVSGGSFETYFNGLSSQIRNTVKRREKKFLASGGRLEIVTGEEGLEPAIHAWDRIYRSSWKVPEPHPEFVPGLIRLCARQGSLRLGLAYYGNVPIAAQIWIVSHGRAAIYKLAYDESHAQHSAGTLLTAHLMRHVLDVDHVKEVDYLIGDDAYKKDWMSLRRERWGIVAYNLLSLRGMSGYGIQILSRLRHRFNRRPPVVPSHGRTKTTRVEQDMKWQVFPASGIEQYAQAWDDLNRRSANSPLLTSSYLTTALRTFGKGREKLACLGNPQAPDCMVVLVERRGGVWDTFQPAQAPIGFWLMRPGLDLEAALDGLVQVLPGLPLMVGITQQDPELLPRPESSSRLQTLDYIETARIMVDGDFDAYWESRGKNLRQNMRKARNKLEKANLEVQLVSITDPAAVKDAIKQYGRLESAGWKAKDGTAVHLDNDQGRFYSDLLETHCQAGTGRIYQLMFNDRIAAMDLCVHRGDVIVILKTTYDEEAAEYSPAMLMHQELFRKLFESGEFKRIEFYGKVMDWHLRFTEDKRTMYHINYYRWQWFKRMLANKSAVIENSKDQTE